MVESGQYLRNTGRLPQWFLDQPQIRDVNSFYIHAFWDLSTERNFRRGPIPTSKIADFAQSMGFSSDLIETFGHVLRGLDEEFLTYTSPKS